MADATGISSSELINRRDPLGKMAATNQTQYQMADQQPDLVRTQNRKHICIIGSGASGLLAARQCLDEGFQITIYEKTDFLGGLWHYHEDDTDGIASVMRSTIINSSKEMSAFSDFPPPAHFPNYMHNTKMDQYIRSYAETFNAPQYIKFKHMVLNVDFADDYDLTGRWKVTVKNLQTNSESTIVYDGVMVCTGHHVTPMTAQFPGQEKFKGKIMHSHSYKVPNGFDGKKVVVVGIGNSGGDLAVELSQISDHVYLSTRRGSWIVHRVGPSGVPFDTVFLSRLFNIMFNATPYNLTCTVAEAYINSRFDHKRYGLKPTHRIFGQHIMVNDALPNRILSGTVTVKGDIKEFTEDGVLFEGDEEVTKCDAVIMATGYRVWFPFISEKILPTKDNRVELYKYAFSPKLKHPETIAFIGLAQPIGPLFPISEIQSRWFTLLNNGKLKLPSVDEMMKDIDAKWHEHEWRYARCPRHTVQVDWINYMDEVASLVGVKPNMSKLFFTDPELWYALMFGPSVPYQYRLTGPHSWPGARRAILTVPDRIEAPLKTRTPPGGKLANGDLYDQKRSARKYARLFTIFFALLALFFIVYLLSGLF